MPKKVYKQLIYCNLFEMSPNRVLSWALYFSGDWGGVVSIFICPVCEKLSYGSKASGLREGYNCRICGATGRERSVALAVKECANELKRDLKSEIMVVGVSDGGVTEKFLKSKYGVNYTNYHFHQQPHLDIKNPPLTLEKSAEIVVCSEVLEHVSAPVHMAFEGLFKILKPGGYLVMSVPHTDDSGVHLEHFPEMSSFEVDMSEAVPVLRGTDLKGEYFESRNLVFHGGIGETLEHRVFSESSLISFLYAAGFSKVSWSQNSRIHGVQFEPWSRVWIARS